MSDMTDRTSDAAADTAVASVLVLAGDSYLSDNRVLGSTHHRHSRFEGDAPRFDLPGAVRALHDASPRKAEPWIVHDCADPSCLHESRTFVGEYSELFPGHYHRYLGLLEQARGGTVLLRHVEALGGAAQRTLAAVFEQRFFTPIRGNEARPYTAVTVLTVSGDLDADGLVSELEPGLRRQVEAGERVVLQEDANA